MPLCTPLLIGPLTEWSDSLLVKGCLPGAEIVVSAIGPTPRLLARATAAGGADRIALLPGERLRAQDRLIVRQQLGGETSLDTPAVLALPVAPAPSQYADLAPLAFRSQLFPCGQALWVAGAVPGALVKVERNNTLIASGRATESGDARLGFAGESVGPNADLSTWQEAPTGFSIPTGIPKRTTAVVDRLPAPFGQPLPTPLLTGPAPRGCEGSVPVGGIIDGAVVTIRRASDGSSETAAFDLDRLRFDLLRPLDPAGDKLEITQALLGCAEWAPSGPLVVQVGPAGKPAAPQLHPPCAGTADVYVEQLQPGAIVTLSLRGVDYRGMAPPDETSFVFRLERLSTGDRLTAVQELCGLKSDPGSATVLELGRPPLTPDLEEPLFACARAVRTRARPGAWLQVWGDSGDGPGPLSPQVFAAGSTRIYVAPYLIAHQAVWLASLSCGDDDWERSPVHTVQPAPDLPPPQISEPPVEGARSVAVDAIPGALVHIYSLSGSPLQVQLLGTGVVDPLGMRVFLWRGLTTKELVFPVQALCGTSRAGAARSVLPGSVAFYLSAPLKRPSNQTATMKPLVCWRAAVVCHHNGAWEYTAELENEEEEADVSFDLQFDLQGVAPPFGLALPGDLSAAGSGPITRVGLRTQGVPPNKSFLRTGSFPGFRDPTYWAAVYAAGHTFNLINVAWRNYQPTPEAPDEEDKDDKKPAPGTKK